MTNEQKSKEIYNKYKYDKNLNKLATESAAFNAAMEMAEWKEQQMIEKAVKWIKSQMIPYGASPLAIFNYIEEFKQAVKGD